MFGNTPAAPFFTSIGPATATSPGFLTTSAQTLNGPKTWQVTAQAGTAENPIATWKVSDAAGDSLAFANSTVTDSIFAPMIVGTCASAATRVPLTLRASNSSESAGAVTMNFDSRIGASTTITTRNLCDWSNNGTTILSLIPLSSGANAALSWGTQAGAAPAFTTRSAGTRAVLFGAIDGSHTDYAIGANGSASSGVSWLSVPQATSNFGVNIYGGTTQVWQVRGDGLMTLTGPCQLKSYTVATLPATPAAGQIAYASDAGGNGPCIAMGNGSVWKRCDNTATTVA